MPTVKICGGLGWTRGSSEQRRNESYESLFSSFIEGTSIFSPSNQHHRRVSSIFYHNLCSKKISKPPKITTPHSSASSPTCAEYARRSRLRDYSYRAGRSPRQCTVRCRCRRPRAARRPCRCIVGSRSRVL